MRRFTNRREAGKQLAALLDAYRGRSDVIVLALPRGGVPVAFEVAKAIGAPLDVFTVRKLGAPMNEEYAIGAIASGGVTDIDWNAVRLLRVSDSTLMSIVEREKRELDRRERLYRRGRPPLTVKGRTVIIVDDGLATGSTMRAAVAAVRTLEPARVVVAVPVASRQACSMIREVADDCITCATPEPFYGVGYWYDDFSQTSDAEVLEILQRATPPPAAMPAARSA